MSSPLDWGDSLLAGRRVLVVAPHPDDECYGCGGTIARALSLGAGVHVMVMSVPGSLRHFDAQGSTVEGGTREAELAAAMRTLGVQDWCVVFRGDDHHMKLDARPMAELVGAIERDAALSFERVRPDIVCFPAPALNQDHEAVHRAVLAAARPHLRGDKAFVPVLLAYDQPQLAWNAQPFVPNLYVDIEGFLDRKLEALACHRSQLRPAPHYGSLEAAERLARQRGAEIAATAAEAFHVHRLAI